MVELSRPERLARLLKPVEGSSQVKQIEVIDSPDCPSHGEMTVLAALASGSQVRVAPDNEALTTLLHDEVEAVSVRQKAPLESYIIDMPERKRGTSDAMRTHNRFVEALGDVVESALWAIRESATIEIVNPRSGGTIDRRSCQEMFGKGAVASLHVDVSLTAFRLPDDGMWCLNLDGKEIACIGDKMFGADIPIPRSACFENSSASPSVRLEAVLKGGLDPPFVARISEVVEVFVV